MQDRFKFRAVLKTNDFVILVQPYYILEDSYFIDLNVVEIEFENKYPNDCFWDFIEEIKKQDYIQEISTDGDLIITGDFTNLIQCTGLKDKNGKLIFEGDILSKTKVDWKYEEYTRKYLVCWDRTQWQLGLFKYQRPKAQNNRRYDRKIPFKDIVSFKDYTPFKEFAECEVIGNIYENKELIDE